MQCLYDFEPHVHVIVLTISFLRCLRAKFWNKRCNWRQSHLQFLWNVSFTVRLNKCTHYNLQPVYHYPHLLKGIRGSWCFVKLSPHALWQLWWAAHQLWVSSLPPSWRWSMPHCRHPLSRLLLPMSVVSKMFLYSQVSDKVVRVGSKLLQMTCNMF